MKVAFDLNGRPVEFEALPGESLLACLRRHGRTEVKNGCASGDCGACLVLLDGRPVNSCMVFAAAAAGRSVTTVQGLGTQRKAHVLQEALAETGAVQCGFCTPGIVVAASALLRDNPDPGEQEIRRALDGNLCRCTGYVKIVAGVKLAAERLRKTAMEVRS